MSIHVRNLMTALLPLMPALSVLLGGCAANEKAQGLWSVSLISEAGAQSYAQAQAIYQALERLPASVAEREAVLTRVTNLLEQAQAHDVDNPLIAATIARVATDRDSPTVAQVARAQALY